MVHPDCDDCPIGKEGKISEEHDFCLYVCEFICSNNRDVPAKEVLEKIIDAHERKNKIEINLDAVNKFRDALSRAKKVRDEEK